MNRRKFIKLTGLSGAAVITLPSLGFVSTSVKDAAVGVIKNELSYLKLNEKGIEQFVNEYYKRHFINHSIKAQLKLRSYYYLHVKPEDSYMVQELVENYLLSSDFFLNKMDEGKEVNYVSLYNPYLRPCANPFSAIYYPAPTV